MPNYVYACSECDHAEEIFHLLAYDGRWVCPDCSTTMIRKPQSYAISMKPTGFGGMH